MLRVLDQRADINRAQNQFLQNFRRIADNTVPVTIGYPGGNFNGRVLWIRKAGIWMYTIKLANRYANGFGIGEPSPGDMLPITCEINFPLEGIDRRIGGALAIDSSGAVFVTHRGKIGGGRKGIGKALFKNNYRGMWVTVKDGDVENDLALIGSLRARRFVDQVARFVFEVARIKFISAGSTAPGFGGPTELGTSFCDEFYGRREKYRPINVIEAECDHGLVVNTLFTALEATGVKAYNDAKRDLYVMGSNGKISVIFEVKTDISRSSVYSAIGQLMLNSVELEGSPRLILTVPEGLNTRVKTALSKLGIELFVYRWHKDSPVFPKLRTLGF